MAQEKELTPEEMKAKIAELEAQNKQKDAQLAQEREDNDKVNHELLAKLEETSLQKDAAAPVVSLGKVKYRVVIPQFQIGDKVYKAKEVERDSDLLKALVKAGSGVLEKIEEKA
jgi:hypothetical protein